MLKVKYVKIVTKYSGFGGSTISLIELCNAFNEFGIHSVMYGPHNYHLDKCPSGNHIRINSQDRVIFHLTELNVKPCQKAILSCHEKSYFPLCQRSVGGFDAVRFVSGDQRDWHQWHGPNFVIPNILEPVLTKPFQKKAAGVIGVLSERKQTHLSIQRALEDGHEVLVFGPRKNSDKNYLTHYVDPLLNDPRVQYMGVVNRDKMYSMICCVYQSSNEECASRTWGECQILGIPFYGNNQIQSYDMWGKEKIIESWCRALNL